ncbi:MAG: DCC1-like thiol-disulfide oxidoreductase family protein [Flavipsychrobacter sp.]
MSLPDSTTPILFFDGVCNLCSSAVQFIIRNDKKHIVRFASLQSVHGQALINHLKEQREIVPDSLLLLYKGKVYSKAAAALRTAAFMGSWWQLLAIFRLVPRVISNFVYDIIARNRYKWFGKKEECMVPTPELKDRFI